MDVAFPWTISCQGTLLELGYGLNRHKVGPLPVSRLVLVVGLAVWVGVGKGWWSPWPAAVLSLTCGALVGIGLWAHHRGYQIFWSEPASLPPDVVPPHPDERIPVRASGQFEVMYKTCEFHNAPAAFSTMDSSEHIIMAHITCSRFLGVGRWPSDEVGWWYIFLNPQMLQSITPGRLCFGPHLWWALEVCYRSTKTAEQKVYLAFSGEMPRARVWAALCRSSTAWEPEEA